MNPPHDPLAGLNPWPQDDVELVSRADGRADLLEEIVSTSPDAPAHRSRALLPVAAVLLLALVGGGIWISTSGSDDEPDLTAAAPSASSSASTETATDPSEPTEATEPGDNPTEVSLADAARGDVLLAADCRAAMRRGGAVMMWRIGEDRDDVRVRLSERFGRVSLKRLQEMRRVDDLRTRPRRLSERGAGPDRALLLTEVRRADGAVVRFDDDCRVVRVRTR